MSIHSRKIDGSIPGLPGVFFFLIYQGVSFLTNRKIVGPFDPNLFLLGSLTNHSLRVRFGESRYQESP